MIEVFTLGVMHSYRPGSRPGLDGWTWKDQERTLLARLCLCCGRPGHYQRALEEYMAKHGWPWESGVILGNDGRVWDGHHRLIAARWLDFPLVPVELYP